MKKYIIILLSFLGLFFINVGIVSADDKVSSMLTTTEIKQINDRIKKAGLPIDHREELFSAYKNFTDYVIYIPESEFRYDKQVKLVLYTRRKDDPDGWSGTEYLDTDASEYMQYDLKYDEDEKKWYWHTWGDYPGPTSMVGIDGYIISSTEPITKALDNEYVFFQPRSPLELILEVAKARIQQMMFQLWQNLVPYGIILLASWISLIILVKVLSVFRVG